LALKRTPVFRFYLKEEFNECRLLPPMCTWAASCTIGGTCDKKHAADSASPKELFNTTGKSYTKPNS
jgi:hypothetical protein